VKITITLVLLCCVVVGQRVHADEVKIPRPHWVIVATMIDVITGEELEKRELAGSAEPEFDDPIICGLAAINIGPIPAKDNRAVVLTCRKVGPMEADL
jgi:hypothetical protein